MPAKKKPNIPENEPAIEVRMEKGPSKDKKLVLETELQKDFDEFREATEENNFTAMALTYSVIVDRMKRYEDLQRVYEDRGTFEGEEAAANLNLFERLNKEFSMVKATMRLKKEERQLAKASTPVGEPTSVMHQPPTQPAAASTQLTVESMLLLIDAMKKQDDTPRIEVPKFRGERKKWREFWNAFEITTHSKPNLSHAVKHTALYGKLEGEAKMAIAYLDQSGETYLRAVKILRDRYEPVDEMGASKLLQITELPAITNLADVKTTRYTYDMAVALVYGITDPEKRDPLNAQVLGLLLGKIPNELKAQWYRQGDLKKQTLSNFLEFLDSHIKSYEFANEINAITKPKLEVKDEPKRLKATVSELATAAKARESDKKGPGRSGKRPARDQPTCSLCQESHSTMACELTLERKLEVVRRERLCMGCLRRGHEGRDCKSERVCNYCREKHHSAICARHTPRQQMQKQTRAQAAHVHTVKALATQISNRTQIKQELLSKVYTKTASILIEGADGWKPAMCLVDDGANISLVHAKFAEQNRLPNKGSIDIAMQVVGHTHPEKAHTVRQVRLKGIYPGAPVIEINALESASIAPLGKLEHTEFATQLWEQGYHLADQRFLTGDNEAREIQLIIGARDIWEVCKTGQIISNNGLRAMESALGWLLLGQDKSSTAHPQAATVLQVRAEAVDEDEPTAQAEVEEPTAQGNFELKLFWLMEHFGALDKEPDEDKILEDLLKLAKRSQSGRFSTGLPWNSAKSALKPKYGPALAQLRSLLRRLDREPKLKADYFAEMQKLIDADFVGLADPNFKGTHVFLPHHCVIRKDKSTTQTRLVFNGSFGELSLNDCVEAGPNLNPDLLDVMLRFRTEPIVWMADVEKAFLMIELDPEDAQALRFLWTKDATGEEVVVLHWKRLPFGLKCSPFLLRAVFKLLLEEWFEDYPEIVEILLKQMYVDDFLGYAPTLMKAITTIWVTISIFSSAGFKMRKWITNHPELRKFLEELGIAGGTTGMISVNVDGTAKALGTGWDTVSDSFFFRPESTIELVKKEEHPTKRTIAKLSAKTYDPLGIIAPIILQFKIIYQELWKLKIDWDKPAPEKLMLDWKAKIEDLAALSNLKIPRTAKFAHIDGVTRKWELHVFCDASMAAYGSVAYIRETRDGFSPVLQLASKTRVAPVNQGNLTLPRIELLAMVIGSQLAVKITAAINHIEWTAHLWTDSRIALDWVKKPPEQWKPFIRNRVEVIRSRFPPSLWRHCPGSENPADLASRGAKATKLVGSKLWWSGPEWLAKSRAEWPQETSKLSDEEQQLVKLEKRAKVVIEALALAEREDAPLLALMERTSKYSRLLNATAWLFRFVCHAMKGSIVATAIERVHGIPTTCLTSTEVETAEILLIQAVQKSVFPDVYNAFATGDRVKDLDDRLKPLRPVWDRAREIILVKGRIGPAMEELGIQPPILLPANHRFTDVLIDSLHRTHKHMGPQSTLLHLRSRFWVIRARQRVKAILKKCVVCQKANGRPFKQAAADLPIERSKPAKPFEVIGVDHAGPLQYIEGEASTGDYTEHQAYLTLFTCAVTRAIHIEVTLDLSTQTFLNAFRRMRARRGDVKHVFSDNGGAFEGASALLKQLQSDPALANWLSTNKINWRFSASLAPWWGGFWERMVRTTKDLLRKGLGKSQLNLDQLVTAVAEVESIVNSRPLTYVPSDQNEVYVLTPTQLITGRQPNDANGHSLSPEEVAKSPKNALVEWDQLRLRTTNAWWRAWTVEYLQDLKKFHVDGKPHKEPKLDQAVLIQDNNKKRLFWNLGIITSLRPGRDGKVRAVTLRLATGNTVKRDVRTLVPLEVGDDQEPMTFEHVTPKKLLEIRAPSTSRPELVAEALDTPQQMEPAVQATADDDTVSDAPTRLRNKGRESRIRDSPGEHVVNRTTTYSRCGRHVRTPARYVT